MSKSFVNSLYHSFSWIWFIVTIGVFVLLLKLSYWQYQRAIDKDIRLAQISQLAQQDGASLTQILALEKSAWNDQPVLLNGHFDNEHTILLDNQTHQGVVGYRVFKVFNDMTTQHLVLVNLGWIAGSVDRTQLPEIPDIVGEHKVKGHVRIMEHPLLLTNESVADITWPLRLQAVIVDDIERYVTKQLLPFVVFLDKTEDIGFVKNWQPIVMPPAKHRAYAFQWFSLAVAWLLLMLWAAYKNNKNKK